MEKTSIKDQVFDFRMDIQSWFMVIAIFIALAFGILPHYFGISSGNISTLSYLLYAFILTNIIIAVCCIPILILCYFINRIPDIDYAVWLGTILVILSVLSIIIG